VVSLFRRFDNPLVKKTVAKPWKLRDSQLTQSEIKREMMDIVNVLPDKKKKSKKRNAMSMTSCDDNNQTNAKQVRKYNVYGMK
jgi:hypothetical protein